MVVIGGGFGGLLAGARLKDAGITDVRIIEKGGDFGGTWYWNRYPGAQCDIESLHLPAAAGGARLHPEGEVHPGARRSSSTAAASASTSASTTGAVFQTEVTVADVGRRRLALARRHRPRRRAAGPLRRAWPAGRCTARSCPASPASDRSRGTPSTPAAGTTTTPAAAPRATSPGWPTSGSAIIGTGATAVQVVPHVGAAAEQLYVFQRTPSSIDVRGNRPTDPEWAASLEPGWQQRRMENFNNLVTGIPEPRTSSTTAGPTSSASC